MIVHLLFIERLTILFNCLAATALAVAAVSRLRSVDLQIHPAGRRGNLYAAATVACLTAGALVVVQVLTGNRLPEGAMALWVIDSCLLVTGFIRLFPGFRRSDLASVTPVLGLSVLASSELIVRVIRPADSSLVVCVSCIFWVCGLLQLRLWSARFLPPVLCESIAARWNFRWLLPLLFVVPVVGAVLVGIGERWDLFDRGYDNATMASIFCIVAAGAVALAGSLLKQTEQGFWALFDAADEAILLVEPGTHQIRSANTRAIHLFGHLLRQPGGVSVEALFPSMSANESRRRQRTALGGLTPEMIEVRWTDVNNCERDLELHSTSASFRGCDSLLVHVRDVSLRYELERRQSQAEKMQALSQLADSISHDLNNLLEGMAICTGLLAVKFEQDTEDRELVNHIDSSIESARQLTDWLLAYCKQRKVTHRRTDLNPLVCSVSEFLKRTICSTISVQTHFRQQIGEVNVDPKQIEEVLINLAINACEAMPQGGTLSFETESVTISATDRNAQIPPGRYLLLVVSDTGVGMDEETASHAFEPFFTTKQRTRGTGMGLSVVYGVVAQSAGFTRLESRLGKGTRVEILLPVFIQNGSGAGDAVAVA